jgi:hypothetical protein
MDSALEIVAINAGYVAACVALHFVLLAWCNKNVAAPKSDKGPSGPFKEWPLVDQIEFVQSINAVATSTLVPLFYALGYYSLEYSIIDRWQGFNTMYLHALSLHAALTIYETWLYITYFPEKGVEFHAHHVLVLTNCWLCLYTKRSCGWGAWFGVVEITNIPLTGITCLGKLKAQSNPLYTACGALLWVMFLIFRIINVPWGLYQMAEDLWYEGAAGGIARVFDDSIMNGVSVFILFGGAFFLWGVSCFWFYKITKGLLKYTLPAIYKKMA